MKKVQELHNGNLLVSVKYRGWLVNRVFVDPGNTYYILFPTVHDMKVPYYLIQQAQFLTYSVNNNDTDSKGEIALPVVVGKKPYNIELIQLLSSLNIASTYNVITGQP